MIVPSQVIKAMIIMGRAIYTDGGTRVVDGETLAGRGCDFPDPLVGVSMSCLVPSLPPEAHLAFFWCQNSLQQHR